MFTAVPVYEQYRTPPPPVIWTPHRPISLAIWVEGEEILKEMHNNVMEEEKETHNTKTDQGEEEKMHNNLVEEEEKEIHNNWMKEEEMEEKETRDNWMEGEEMHHNWMDEKMYSTKPEEKMHNDWMEKELHNN